jgi:hypothetical protein
MVGTGPRRVLARVSPGKVRAACAYAVLLFGGITAVALAVLIAAPNWILAVVFVAWLAVVAWLSSQAAQALGRLRSGELLWIEDGRVVSAQGVDVPLAGVSAVSTYRTPWWQTLGGLIGGLAFVGSCLVLRTATGSVEVSWSFAADRLEDVAAALRADLNAAADPGSSGTAG